MRVMEGHGIQVSYARHSGSGFANMPYGFTWIPEFRCAVKWYTSQIGGRIHRAECIALDGHSDEIERMWSETFPGSRTLATIAETQYSVMAGVWRGYYYSTKNDGSIIETKWLIGALPGDGVTVVDETNLEAALRYSAPLEFLEGHQAHLVLEGQGHIEKWHVVFEKLSLCGATLRHHVE